MILLDVAAAFVGAVVGTIALAWFAYFLKELTFGRVRARAVAAALGLLLGTGIASAPVSHYSLDQPFGLGLL